MAEQQPETWTICSACRAKAGSVRYLRCGECRKEIVVVPVDEHVLVARAERLQGQLLKIQQAFNEWESGPAPADDYPAEVSKVFADRVRAIFGEHDKDTYCRFGLPVHRPQSPGFPRSKGDE